MMKVFAELFREYDIRGLVDSQITSEFAEGLGCAIGTLVRRAGGKKVNVGRDCRASGEALQQAMMRGFCRMGCCVVDIGCVPTPTAYWSVVHNNADAGVQITGSHNPPEYNGFKMTLLGQSIYGEQITQLKTMMEREDFTPSPGGELRSEPMLQAYIEELAALLQPCGRPFKVVVDAGNGTGGIAAVPLYRKLGYDVVDLFCEMDGNFPNHHPDPTIEENMRALQAQVVKEKADLGLAFDGDADRVGVVTREGEIIWGDKVLIVLARAVLHEVPGASILGDVKCSKTLFDDIAKHGGNPIMWRTGHSLIKAKMAQERVELAGEMSGHIFFQHRYYGFDDGIYAGGRLLEHLSRSAETITEQLASVPKTYATPELKHTCSEAEKFELMHKITQFIKAGAKKGGYKIIDIDGVRIEWPDGFALVRASNTQPVLVMRFEANSQARLAEIRGFCEQIVQQQHHP